MKAHTKLTAELESRPVCRTEEFRLPVGFEIVFLIYFNTADNAAVLFADNTASLRQKLPTIKKASRSSLFSDHRAS
jgi:hypothetical protein